MRFAVLSIHFSGGGIKLMESNNFKLKIMKSLLTARFLTRLIPLYVWSYFNITSVVII